ncbi:hypothetical protein ACF0H5_015217 [Mactra antiquata]
MDLSNNLKLFGLLLGCCLFLRWFYLVLYVGTLIPDTWLVIHTITFVIILDILRLHPGRYVKVLGLCQQYLRQKLMLTVGFFVELMFNKMSKDVHRQQQALLRNILEQNVDTDVLRKFGLEKVQTEADFRSKTPLTTYKDYKECANKIVQTGNENVFFPGVVDYIALTSGTTGKSKMFPKSLHIMRKTAARWLLLAQRKALLVPKNDYLRHWLALKFAPKIQNSASGIACGSISGLYSKYSMNSYIVPDVLHGVDDDTVIYINIVFGVKYEDICNLYFATAQMALLFLQTLEKKCEQVCDDIENGTLSDKLVLCSNIRKTLNSALKGEDKERANLLRHEFRYGFKNIVSRVWPECAGVFCMATGAFQTAANVMKERYLGHVPLLSPFHAGTETFYGINLDLLSLEVSYTLMVPFNYFEFIPVEHAEEEKPETKLCHQVVIGKQYELVVTTWEGLYRYRTEDIVQISGYHGTIPCYKFIRRKGDILNIAGEKVAEVLVSESIRKSSKSWNKSITEFVSTENIHTERMRDCVSGFACYVVFIEISHDEILTADEKQMVDNELCKLHSIYAEHRQCGGIKPVRLLQVKTGTFETVVKLSRHLNEASSIMQYKIPKIIRQPELLQHLIDSMLPSQYFYSELSHG